MKVRIKATWFDVNKIKSMLCDLDDIEFRPLVSLDSGSEEFIVTSNDAHFQDYLEKIKMNFSLCKIEAA